MRAESLAKLDQVPARIRAGVLQEYERGRILPAGVLTALRLEGVDVAGVSQADVAVWLRNLRAQNHRSS